MEAQKIVKVLLDHEERFGVLENKMFTKEDGNRLFEILDQHTKILNRLDHEQSSMKLTLRRVQEDVEELKQDVKVLKEDVSLLKEDVKVLKEDVEELKHDVIILKVDVKVLKEDVSILTSDMSLVKLKIAI